MNPFPRLRIARGAARGLASSAGAALALSAHAQVRPAPEFRLIEPEPNSIFNEGQPIPVVAFASSLNDVFTSAEFFANGMSIGFGIYCCPLCPCAHPTAGIATTLQIPYPLGPGEPPRPNPWQGWGGATPGTYILTARTTGENGTQLETPPITIHVRAVPPRILQLAIQRTEGNKLQFALIDGAISTTGFTMQQSHDLKSWENIGEFSPGNVTAFFETSLDPEETRPVFFRGIER